MAFTPSKYQKAVFTYIQRGKGNAVIEAVAGSGKSTTLVQAINLIDDSKKVLFLAFNVDIVAELKKKIGPRNNVEISTLHSLGCKACVRAYHSTVEGDKYSIYLNDGIASGAISPRSERVRTEREKFSEWKSNIVKLIDLGRVNLALDSVSLCNLADKHGLWLQDNEVELAQKIIAWGTNHPETIDFTDMIYIPSVKDIRLFQRDWVFVDECQDLNAAQRTLFLKTIKPNGGRFVAVGDAKQSIYGFCGADEESFYKLTKIPHTAKLPLSICYRCDANIIRLAQSIVPQIQWRDGAGDGIVDREAKMADVKDGDMVLCRVSAPLTKLCMHYISNGVKAYVKGKDIGANLINMIKKTRAKNMDKCFEKLNAELGKLLGKIMDKKHCNEEEARENDQYKIMEDKIMSIQVLSDGLTTCDAVMNRISSIFSDDAKEGICLSTIHKSKGLENDRVFVLCEDKLFLKAAMRQAWSAQQEYNLVYVMMTRAKHYLGYIQDFTM